MTDKARRDGHERRIARPVPQSLVQFLHVAHVDEQDVDVGRLAVGDLEQSGSRHEEAATVAQAGQLVTMGQLEQPGAELLHLVLGGHPAADVVQEVQDLDVTVLGVKDPRRRLDLEVAPVATAHARHAHGRPGAVSLGGREPPTGVFLVEDAVATALEDLFGAQAEEGTGGRVGGGDPAVAGRDEHALGIVCEQDLVGGEPHLIGVPYHHPCSSHARAMLAVALRRDLPSIEDTQASPRKSGHCHRLVTFGTVTPALVE